MKLPYFFAFSTLAVLLLTANDRAAAQSPPEAELHFTTGVMHLREGRFDLALSEFKQAVRGDPKSPYFQKGLGQAYAAKREWGRAIAAFRKALELNPHYVDATNDLGYALTMSGDRAGGKQQFLTGFSDPQNPTPEISAFNLGRAYLEEGNQAEAIQWFRTSISRNKAYSMPYLLLAETLASMQRLPEAIAQLETGVRDAAGDAGGQPELLFALGRAYLKAGRTAEARTQLEAAVKADSGGPVGAAAAEQLKTLPR